MTEFEYIIKKAYQNPKVAKKYYEDFFDKDILIMDPKESFLRFVGEIAPDGTVLDLGCGNGQHSILIAEKYRKSTVIGVDFSAEMLVYANKKASEKKLNNASFVCEELIQYCERMKSKPNAVLFSFSLTCLTEKEIKKILQIVFDKMNKDGVIFIAVHEDLESDGNKGRFVIEPEIYCPSEEQYYKYFKKDEIIDFVKNAGFTDYKMSTIETQRTTEINNNKIFITAYKRCF